MCLFQGVECPWRLNVREIGIQTPQAVGCLMDAAWLATFVVPCYQSWFQPLMYIDLPDKKLLCLRPVGAGQFGAIDLARLRRIEGGVLVDREVYVKRPAMNVYEPYLQEVVRVGLTAVGFLDPVPRVVEVFALRSGAVCFAMEQVVGGMTLDHYLTAAVTAEGSIGGDLWKDMVCTVSVMVWWMNDGLGVNHRDLKPSNFLVRRDGLEDRVVAFEVEGERVEWQSSLRWSLIDFGFACAGDRVTREARLSLSRVYSARDPCPKGGRDLFLFLGHLYSDYHSLMDVEWRGRMEQWLDIPGSNLCAFLRKDREVAKRWLYFLSGEEHVFQLQCCPKRVLRDLMAAALAAP